MTKHHHPKPLMDTPLGPTGGQRLYSLDALRGFDMFWILGAEDIFNELAKATGLPAFQWISNQLTHPAWNGFHLYDLIFPHVSVYGRSGYAIFRGQGIGKNQ